MCIKDDVLVNPMFEYHFGKSPETKLKIDLKKSIRIIFITTYMATNLLTAYKTAISK